MSKISYPQLIKNIANAYRNATGSSEPIAIGELTNKLEEAMSNGSGNGNNTIAQQILSCEAGITQVILPINVEPAIAEINSSNIEIETSVTLESEE